MDRLITSSLTAMRGAMARQTATANNLANANTTGFRAEISNANAQWLDGQSFKSRALQDERVIAANMANGAVTTTGNALDVSLNGDALLSVQASDGSEAYTRRGDLKLTDSGLLTTGDGSPVLGEGGPITLPPADKITIANDGSIWIVPPGGQIDQPQQVDKLKLVSPTGSQVAKGTDGLFREMNGGALPQDPLASVTPESLEGSNVNPTQALVDMIEASRAWDTQVKMISTAKDIDEGGTSLMKISE